MHRHQGGHALVARGMRGRSHHTFALSVMAAIAALALGIAMAFAALKHYHMTPHAARFNEHEHFANANQVCAGGFVREIPNFLSDSECDAIRAAAVQTGLTASEVDAVTGSEEQTDQRSSSQAWIEPTSGSAAQSMQTHTSELLAGLGACVPDRHSFQAIQVVKYTPGGKYDAHHDARDCAATECPPSQRFATVLVYLSDDFEGGTTTFPTLGVSVQPRKGKAVFFWVSDPSTREVFEETLHSGDAVTSGEKWIATQWVLTDAE